MKAQFINAIFLTIFGTANVLAQINIVALNDPLAKVFISDTTLKRNGIKYYTHSVIASVYTPSNSTQCTSTSNNYTTVKEGNYFHSCFLNNGITYEPINNHLKFDNSISNSAIQIIPVCKPDFIGISIGFRIKF